MRCFLLFTEKQSVICQRGDRHSSFPSRLEVASDPDARQPAPPYALYPPRSTSQDCRPRIVLSRTAQQWRFGPLGETVSQPACTQRCIRRGAALASSLYPLAFSGDQRGRCKALFSAVLNGTAISDPEPVRFSCDPENWSYGQADRKRFLSFPLVSARGARFLQPRRAW